jgi:phage gp45-like
VHGAEWIRRLLDPLAARVRALAARGVVRLSDDQQRAQELQVSALAGEVLSKVERFGEFGFVSRPPAGTEVLLISLGGDRGHTIAVATENRDVRPQGLAEGEAGIYAAAGGSVVARITLRADGTVEITAPSVTISGDLVVQGDVSDSVGSLQEFRDAYNAHTHGETGGTTSPPTPTVP